MHDQLLIEKMRDMKAAMVFIAQQLVARGNVDNGEELENASRMVQDWIDGISDEISAGNAK